MKFFEKKKKMVSLSLAYYLISLLTYFDQKPKNNFKPPTAQHHHKSIHDHRCVLQKYILFTMISTKLLDFHCEFHFSVYSIYTGYYSGEVSKNLGRYKK